ncbi:MAG: prolipoprotein diacylglyceryl transferase [Verrucomicrobiales bacterium]
MTLQILADTTHYVHSWDPFMVQFSEKWGIRFYGFAYVLGFFAAFLILRWFSRRGYSEMPEEKVADFITFAAIVGVMLGGRLGYMLFYDWDNFMRNPTIFFNFLGGGMASHGGILGLVIFTWFYAKRTKLSWAGIGDNLVVVAPLGLMFGRLANFVNGELYGRVSQVKWAMKFPSELRHQDEGQSPMFSAARVVEIANHVGTVDSEVGRKSQEILTNETIPLGEARYLITKILIGASEKSQAVRDVLGEFLNPRHPSQLYQAAGEGLLLFLILFLVRIRFKNLYHGILTGLFFILYAIARIVAENFREPDAPLVGSMTKGQFLSTFMIAIGAAFIIWAMKTKRTNKVLVKNSK